MTPEEIGRTLSRWGYKWFLAGSLAVVAWNPDGGYWETVPSEEAAFWDWLGV